MSDMGNLSPSGGPRPQGRVIPFGKYLLLERLAVGGMAEVFLAKSFGVEGFEKILAIKRILPTMAEDEDFIEMFIDEAKIAGHLNHANIVPIYELGKIGESHYIAMEYVWGKDLLQIMNRFRRMRKRMPAAMVAFIASKMCEALEYAHNKRDRKGRPLDLIHRDVSPQNILVSYDGAVKLIDFGIAKAASRTTKTQAGVLKGKFGYMSPEQVRGQAVDHRSDIFAVGTCMYEMLTSERLFVGESDFSTLEKVRSAAVAPPSHMVSGCPPEFDAIVMRTLARDPDERYQTAGELQESLQTFLVTQRPPYTTSKLASWMKTAFPGEVDQEKARLDGYAHIGRPSVLGATKQPALEQTSPDSAQADLATVDEEISGEATMVTASPFEEGASEPPPSAELQEEATTIFFSADEMEIVEESDAPAAEPAATGRVTDVDGMAVFGRPDAAPERPKDLNPQAAPSPTLRPPHRAAQSRPPGSKPREPAAPPPPTPAAKEASARQPLTGPVPPGAAPIGGPTSGVRPGRQRHIPTMEMQRAPVQLSEPPPAPRRTVWPWMALGAAAVLLLSVGIAAAWVVFGGDATGILEVRTVPDVGATVLIDGQAKGRAPLRIERVRAGERTLEVRAQGYEPSHRVVQIDDGSFSQFEFALQPGPSTSEPTPPPEVAAPPETPETAPAVGDDEASADPEALEVDAPEETPTRTTDRPSRRATATPRPTKRATGPAEMSRTSRGSLTIMTMPWARVFLDGRDTGKDTPVRNLRVPAGSHTIGLRTADGQMHTVTVDVPAGENLRITRRL